MLLSWCCTINQLTSKLSLPVTHSGLQFTALPTYRAPEIIIKRPPHKASTQASKHLRKSSREVYRKPQTTRPQKTPRMAGADPTAKKEEVAKAGVGAIIRNAQGQIIMGKRKGSHGSGKFPSEQDPPHAPLCRDTAWYPAPYLCRC